MQKSGLSRLFEALGCALILSACGGGTTPSNGSATVRSEGTEAISDESTRAVAGASLTLQAQAQFERYDDYGFDSGANKGLVHLSTYNIRYAEVQLFNSAGSVIQAGTTDGTGSLSGFVMPKVAGTYRLEVHSRGYNSHVKASVLTNPYDKNYYTLSKSFTLSGSETSPYTVTLPKALTTGGVLSGAFNIFNDIVLVNEYLAAHTAVQSNVSNPDYCPSTVCSGTFTTAPKVQAYWTAGLTPATYYGDSTTPISFFVPASGGGVYTGLYILGGVEGSTCTDTDHFDNSVIIHEYGHFLEKAYAYSDSPGGSHDGNGIIDPRLAWSEGWADFLQSIVLARAFYRDTKGNASCSSGPRLSFSDFILSTHDGNDTPIYAGDGNFREMAIARMLRSTVVGGSQGASYPANGNGVSANFGFAVIWSAFKSLGSGSLNFRNVGHITGLIYGYLTNLGQTPSSNAWSDDAGSYGPTAVLTYEKTRHDLKDYAAPLTAMGACAGANSAWFPRVIASTDPVADSYSGGTLTYSDPLNTNDFFAYTYDGNTAHAVINLNYKADVAGTPYDLDMYLYSSGYTFLENSSILRKSEGYYPESGAAAGYTGHEQINLSGLPAGTYMINVKVDYPGGARKAATQYSLVLGNGDYLCP